MPKPGFPDYDEWIRETSLGAGHMRSMSLRAIDSALKAYLDEPERFVNGKRVITPGIERKASTLRLALQAWIRDQGDPAWKRDERNKTRMFEKLQEALYRPFKDFDDRDQRAFTFQEQARRKRIATIFKGKHLVWQAFNAPTEFKMAHADFERLTRNLARPQNQPRHSPRQTYAADRDAIEKARHAHDQEMKDRRDYRPGGWNSGRVWAKFISDIFGGVESITDIGLFMKQQTGIGVGALGASVIPIVSNITSGVSMLFAWGSAARARYREYEVYKNSWTIDTGTDMKAALKGLETMLDRQTTAETIQATIQTADFASRTALNFVDFGAASSAMVGMVSSLSKLVHKLYLLGREYREKCSANKLLRNPDSLDCKLFTSYPLLGCYMLVCSDLSEIISMTTDFSVKKGVPFGAVGFKEDVVNLKNNHIDPVVRNAARVIYKAPFFIPGMPVHALYRPDGIDKMMQKYSKVRAVTNITRVGLGLLS